MCTGMMTAARFGGVTLNGITFVEFEDGDAWCALGHVDKAAMAEAVNEWFRGNGGGDERFEADAVVHAWAIETQPPTGDDTIDWWLSWDGVTSATPGSFAISLISA